MADEAIAAILGFISHRIAVLCFINHNINNVGPCKVSPLLKLLTSAPYCSLLIWRLSWQEYTSLQWGPQPDAMLTDATTVKRQPLPPPRSHCIAAQRPTGDAHVTM
jgi:hypothetical protein